MGIGFYNMNRSIPMDWRRNNNIYKDYWRLSLSPYTFVINPYNRQFITALSDLMIDRGKPKGIPIILFLYI